MSIHNLTKLAKRFNSKAVFFLVNAYIHKESTFKSLKRTMLFFIFGFVWTHADLMCKHFVMDLCYLDFRFAACLATVTRAVEIVENDFE